MLGFGQPTLTEVGYQLTDVGSSFSSGLVPLAWLLVAAGLFLACCWIVPGLFLDCSWIVAGVLLSF